MGVATRAMSRPLGRVQRASSRPTGIGQRRHLFDALGHRFDARVVRAPAGRAWRAAMPSALAASRSSRIGGQNFGLARANGGGGGAATPCSWSRRSASRTARAASRAASAERHHLGGQAHRSCRARSCRLSRQRQIVAMDHLVPATIAQNGLDFDRAFAGDPLCVRRIIGGQAARDFAALAGPCTSTASPRSKRPSIWRMPAGSRLLPSASALTAPSSMISAPSRLEHAGDPALARRGRRQRWRGKACGARPCAIAATGLSVSPLAMIDFAARAGGDLGGDQLGRHAAAADAGDASRPPSPRSPA